MNHKLTKVYINKRIIKIRLTMGDKMAKRRKKAKKKTKKKAKKRRRKR